MLNRDSHSATKVGDILPFEVGYLPDIYQKKAQVELHETPEKREQCVRQLKEKLRLDKRTKYIEFNEDFLLQHLRARKFNGEKAFSTLKNYVVFFKKNPQLFSDFNYDIAVKSIKDDILTILPWRCKDGCAVMVVELDNWKPDKFPIEEVKRLLVVLLLQALQEPLTQVNGFKFIINVKSTSPLRYVRHCTPQNLYLLYHGTQDCCAARYKEIHILNDSLPFRAAWLIVKHILSDKLKKRFHFHSSKKTLQEFFPKSILPTTFGGDLQDWDQSNWLKRVMSGEQLADMGGGVLKHIYEPL